MFSLILPAIMLAGIALIVGLAVLLASQINKRERRADDNRHLHEPEVHLGATALQNHHRI